MNRILAIGLDAPDHKLITEWIEQGKLQNLNVLKRQGSYTTFTHTKQYRNERCWHSFLTGISSEVKGNCGSVFSPKSYEYYNETNYGKDKYPPFYALGNDYNVAVFDLPVPLSEGVNGIQVLGWASELNQAAVVSQPPELIAEIINKYGADPKAIERIDVYDPRTDKLDISFVLPSLYDKTGLDDFKQRLLISVRKRGEIILELLQKQSWDLFLALFCETHTTNHLFWHLDNTHPLSGDASEVENVLLEVMQEIDIVIGQVMQILPNDMHIAVFSVDSTTSNSMDVPSMMLLPEFIYRWNYPGQAALALSDTTQPLPSHHMDYSKHWKHEIWRMRTADGDTKLESPDQQEKAHSPLSWNPANWYKSLWSSMKAFALPSVGDGYIRINLEGRESQGIVPFDDYEVTISELSELLDSCINPRTGNKLVSKVIRTRVSALDDSDLIPPDLIVCWNNQDVVDVLDHPDLGRIGPVPFFRSGGHHAHGETIHNLMIMQGPMIQADTLNAHGFLEDLPATLLDFIGAQRPAHFDGVTLLNENWQKRYRNSRKSI